MSDTDEQSDERPRTNQLVRRNFGGMEIASEGPQTQALIASSVASIQARWTVAMRCRRNLDDVRQDIMHECKRPAFAEVATYSRPVGKKYNDDTGQWEEQFADGLSIRFAEVALRCMTNMSCDTVTIFDSQHERIVRVTATDYESNGTWSRDITIKKTVERKKLKRGQNPIGTRVNSYGDTVFIVEASDSEVAVKEAAEISKASRTGILRLIPGHIQDEAFDTCRRVAADKEAKDPDAARARILDAFASISLSREDLEEYIGMPLAKASPAQIAALRQVFTAIRDGETTWGDVITTTRDAKAAKPATAPPAAPPPKAKPDPAPAATSSPTPAPESAPAPTVSPNAQTPTPAPGPASKRGTAALKTAIATDAPKTSAASSFAAAKDKARNADATREAPPPADEPNEVPCSSCGVPIDLADGADPKTAQCYACSQS
jgi:hypothetical protein